MRKASLFVASCIALVAFLGLSAQAFAEIEPICNNNALSKGIYPPSAPTSANKGKFDLSYSPTTAHADAEIDGGAILCSGSSSVFYRAGRLTFPGRGETVRCAIPSTTGQCPAGSSLANGLYSGFADVNAYCAATLCFGAFIQNLITTTTVTYNTSGPGNGPNRCLPGTDTTIVACFESKATVAGQPCGADIITRKPTGGKYNLTIYPTTCGGIPDNQTYFTAINNLQLCKYAGSVGGNACGADPANWMQRNGNAGAWTVSLGTALTDSSRVTASATGSWT